MYHSFGGKKILFFFSLLKVCILRVIRCSFIMLQIILGIAASCVVPSSSYNPSPVPPSNGRFPIGYDPQNRGRPFDKSLGSSPPLRKDVLRARRWQPPQGYRPRRTDRMPLRCPSTEQVEYIKWENPPKTQNSTLCTGIWCNNRILYKTCVSIDTTTTED
jgi:hypothetical protein